MSEESFPAFPPSGPPHLPDVDEILRGEYTGWIPIIRPGMAPDGSYPDGDDEPHEPDEVEMADPDADEPDVQNFVDNQPTIVDDQPTIVIVDEPLSPAQVLEQARRRIEQMRQNLQTSLDRMAEEQFAFSMPEMTPASTEESQTAAPIEESWSRLATDHQSAEEIDEPVVTGTETDSFITIPSEEPPVVEAEEPIEELNARTWDEQWSWVDEIPAEESQQPPAAYYETTQNLAVADTGPSLELAIMRDEIQDLRTRLDASTKLIEDLTMRLANLAELALRKRD